MQITLDVNGSQLDSEVKELLAALTEEQKSSMAMDILAKTLANSESRMSIDIARDEAVKIINADRIDDYRKVKWHSDRKRLITMSRGDDADYSDRERFEKLVKEKSDVASFFKDKVLASMVKVADEEVTAAVRNSVELTAAIEEAKKQIQSNLPKMVNDAMVIYFASQMTHMMEGIAGALFQSGNAKAITNQLQQSLASKGIY